MYVVGLPGPPESASVIEISPTTVLLDIKPPLDNGGVEIYGYQVQYLMMIHQFMIGIVCFQFLRCLVIFRPHGSTNYYMHSYGLLLQLE